MNAPVLAEVKPPRTALPWGTVILPLCLGVLLLGLAFNEEVAVAVQTWIDSTAYNHCFLVIPIAAYLLWERKADLAAVAPAAMPSAVLFGIPVALVWLAAERLGIMEGRQLAVITILQVLFIAVLGRRLYWAACGPLLYLYFLVPFGEFLTPRLQDFTTWFIRHGLVVIGIPAYIDGYVIEIAQGTFLVAEACAGLRFLIASIAFGCLYALLMYRSPVRRAVFILASIIVPIIANGFRGLGIVFLGYLLNSAQAAAADHVLYGWIFFSIVILLLIVIGLPFREDALVTEVPPPAPPPVGRAATGKAFVAAFGAAVIAAIGPLAAAGISRSALTPLALPQTIPVGPDCETAPLPVTLELGQGGQRVTCGTQAFDMVWQALPPRVTAGALMAARRRLIRPVLTEQMSERWLEPAGGPSRPWRIMQAGDPPYALGVAIWADGKAVRPGMTTRLQMATDSLFGTRFMPIVMTVTPVVSWDTLNRPQLQKAIDDLQAFLVSHPELDGAVGQSSAVR